MKTCRGGANDGDPCVNNSHCPSGGICDKECVGGANVGLPCGSNADCPASTRTVVTNTAFCGDRCGRCTP
ncbi:MAG: hypothetical protein V1790_11435 [Planctomycetota bacterium]